MPATAVKAPEPLTADEVARIAADAASKAVADLSLHLRDPNALAQRAATADVERRREAAAHLTDKTAAEHLRMPGQPDTGQRYTVIVYPRTAPGEGFGGLAWCLFDNRSQSRAKTSLDVKPGTLFATPKEAAADAEDYFVRKAKVGVFEV